MKSLGNIRRSFAPWADPQAKPYISIRNVTKRFGEFVAVNDVSRYLGNCPIIESLSSGHEAGEAKSTQKRRSPAPAAGNGGHSHRTAR